MIYRVLDSRINVLRQQSYEFKTFFLLSAAMFAGAITLGGIFYEQLAEAMYGMLSPTLATINQMDTSYTRGLAIFLKNLSAVLIMVLLARRTRGISLAILLVANGLMIGTLLTKLYMTGVPLAYILSGLLPHGVFEFTGILTGTALGFQLLFAGRENLASHKNQVKNMTLKAVIPVLLIAAVIESFITPFFMS